MKELKRGDFVYHKELGRGIVSHVGSEHVAIEVHFENKDCLTMLNRVQLFVKGDRVNYKTKGENQRWSRDAGSFFEPMLHNPHHCNSKYTIRNTKHSSGIAYVFDVKHSDKVKQSALFPSEELEILNTAEHVVTNYPIQAQSLCKTMERAGVLASWGVEADKVLKDDFYNRAYNVKPDDSVEKKNLIKRIKVLELQAQIREIENEVQ